MAGMFDAFAKRAARRAAADSLHSADSRPHGVSRRRVVAGAAWTAPALALTTASNAWAVGSTGGLGQSCGNLGQGTCNSPYKCNGNIRQCNNCIDANICGGEGASCCDSTQCDQSDATLVCVQQPSTPGFFFCRRPCTTPGSPAGCSTGQICSTAGFCGKSCTANRDCLGSAICAAGGVCSYQPDSSQTVCP